MTMNTISIEDKVKIASDFLLSSPPGEVNDVFNDVRTLVGNDEALQEGVLQSLEQYNAEQHVTVIPPGLDYEVIISKHGKISEDRYLDPRSKQTFKFDHIRLAASDLEEYTTDDSNSLEVLRAAIDEECSSYVYDHYPNGVSTVYNNSKEIIIAIVDNKYNPSNYWNGKWLASWIYDTQKDTLRGMTVVNVHYYEDGNVQLNAEKNVEVELSRTEVFCLLVILPIKASLIMPMCRILSN
ncbi:F-actin-capping protein subunit alpha [Mycotypha africana]|uniref:F-actin-capping protein subunit alpha n=1 Tax=Mycotypha africana TaxID=64632 RepID=UPI0023000F13|nr:F-actin-capping protein subunit alpha [Mycotypha africana]KAI8990760.1 F-actin-capping protein subunit alpha [Mycotypha africana]